MKELITHLLRNNLDEIVQKSLLNCHCIGLHSIMLLDSPGKTIRLYVTSKDHEMYLNLPEYYKKRRGTISFHPHHCNLTLNCVYGGFLNWEVKEVSGCDISYVEQFPSVKYIYKSKISDGELRFTEIGTKRLETVSKKFVAKGESIYMLAKDIHTVGVPKNQISAWLVYEGNEDPNYESVCYSENDLNNFDDKVLYMKPTEREVIELLRSVKLI